MDICYNLMPRSFSEMEHIAQASEQAGLHSIGIADSPLIARDLYVGSAACLRVTEQLNVFTAVTNPVTRHPSVTATAALSLCDMAPGRVAIGLATGDSALWGVGLRPATIAELRDYIVTLKTLLRGGDATWHGNTFKGHWNDFDPAAAPPVYVACSGPKVLRMAMEVADGIIPAMGYAPENIDYVRSLVDTACEDFGRERESVDIWWYADTIFGTSAESILAKNLSSESQWLLMGSTQGKLIPKEYIPLLRELHADTHNLESSYKDPDRGLVLVERAKTLGLYDWLLARSPRLVGTPEEVGQRLAELNAAGLDKWCLWQDGGEGGPIEFARMLGAATPR
jgi:5,10-methylenetetrahydromethanopterin reductase